MGLMDEAKKNIITKEIQEVANYEQISTAIIINGINDGSIVIPKNIKRNLQRTVAVGKGLKTKVNANLGTSPDHISIEEELEKMDIAVKAGADAIMDLSTGGNLIEIRKEILARCPVCVGTVPIYQVACQTVKQKKKISQMDPELMFDVIEEQAEEGVDFMTIHCGINRETVEILKRQPRHTGVVSRGGSFLVKWINANNKENPYYEQYDRLLKIAQKYDITLSLGDGFRPGCTFDASDGPQLAELSVLGELVSRARAVGVQTMIEGPGHMPLDQIQANVLLAKRLGHNAPLYFLGPLVTDIAPGYDHITSAIGGAMAASYGVDFICYVTPAEHLRLPNAQDVHDGVIAARIAAHSADIVKNVKGARQQDFEISKWRKERNWDKQKEFSIDPVKFEKERAKLLPKQSDVCTMCGEFCSMKEEL
ncbi:MAG: phosphomethylpyrimidine synthase ThiC [Endomicrobiaceae bacterium]|nr:phosphomethylpyrimidine synthase ThiC [Endomicrobiaceae bacterium]MDD3922320.1 phosphomethylpyrimidine synthase ThiC [Endomicrobiaceae bacterium]